MIRSAHRPLPASRPGAGRGTPRRAGAAYGLGPILRLNRDVRFSPDKRPYHTNVRIELTGAGTHHYLSVSAHEVIASVGVLRAEPGWIERFRRAVEATHQSCLAHWLRRVSGMIEAKVRGHSTVPVILKGILLDALALRDRRDEGGITRPELDEAIASLESRVADLLARRAHTEENRRLLKHLRNEAGALFRFLRRRDVDATNYRAEQGVRPAVVNRKVWGGRGTDAGARTQERLMSLLRTTAQQGADALAILTELIRSPVPMVAPLAVLAPRAP